LVFAFSGPVTVPILLSLVRFFQLLDLALAQIPKGYGQEYK
jgi:hypothetical protein